MRARKKPGMRLNCSRSSDLPGNGGVVLQVGLAFLAEGVHGRVDFLQPAARGVFHDARPGFVGFAQRDRVGVARPAVAAQRFVRHFGDVRPAHHDGDAGGAQRVRHPVRLGHHAGHGADADQPDPSVRRRIAPARRPSLGCVLPSISMHLVAGRRQRL